MSAPSKIMPEWEIVGPSTPALELEHAFSIHFDGTCIALVNAKPEGSEAIAKLIGNVPGLVTSMRLALEALSMAGNDSRPFELVEDAKVLLEYGLNLAGALSTPSEINP